MSYTPLVSVYITNHNYGRFVEQAIQSVLGQTLKDWELLVIDDGSTDDSHSVIERFEGVPSVTIIFQEKHGLNVTNNIALRAARGKYIVRLDADDYLDENALSVLAGVLDRNPDVGLVFPDYYLIDEDGHVTDVVRRHDFREVTLMDQPAHGACTLIRRECLEALGGYNESLDAQDGYDIWLRFIRRFKVQNVNLPLFYYRRHPHSLTANENRILSNRARILEDQSGASERRLTAVAVIPVRGAKLDPASHALRPLGGRPLIEWTLAPALESKRLSEVIVSTPDDNVARYVEQAHPGKARVVRRPPQLARPNTRIEETLLHILENNPKAEPSPDAIVVLYVESPFRTALHIDQAVHTLEVFQTDTVVAVRPDIDEIYKHNGAGLEPLRMSGMLRLEREELYREVGQIRAVRREFLVNHRKIVGGRVGHFTLDERACLRIRSEWDWEMAEDQARRLLPLSREGHAPSWPKSRT